jgi:elongation factor G
MFVPEPVISLTVKPVDKKSQNYMSKALNRFTREDPTFRSYVDEESHETIISGMGELHLEVYIERMKREFNAEVVTGMPQVAYREAITKMVSFDYTHKKQTGGSGQFGRVAGFMEPSDSGAYEFVNEVKGGSIPTEYLSSVDKGFQSCFTKGKLIGFPVLGMKITVNDGKAHSVDSSEKAFVSAAVGAFRQAYLKAKPIILEPVMKLNVEGPSEFQGNVMSSINQRRGIITSSTEDGVFTAIEADVPLAEMFGYATALRSLTQGKAEFTMEFARYAKVPEALAEDLKLQIREKSKGNR